jgi:general secretion pathway protein D
LRATANKLAGCLLVGLLLWPASQADAGFQTVMWATLTVACGQAPPSLPAANGMNAREMLARARLAMKEGKFQEAEALINQADRNWTPGDPLIDRYEDSPERARRTLASLRELGASPAGAENASRYSNAASTQLGAPTAAPAANDVRGQNREALLSARMALARGDMDETIRQLNRAKSLNVSYGLNDDSPQKIESLLQQQMRLSNVPQAAQQDPAYQRSLATLFMQQADHLMLYGALDSAQELAQRAKSLGVAYQAYERTPESLLRDISARRQPDALAGNPGPSRLPSMSADNAAKDEARRLVAQARMEMDRGNLPAAQQLADQARGMNVSWDAGDTQPWQILLEVGNRMRRQPNNPVMRAGYDSLQAGGGKDASSGFPVRQGLYTPDNDPSRVMAASNLQTRARGDGQRLYEQGLLALENQDPDTALELFRQAWQFQDQLDPTTRQQLKDKLTFLAGNVPAAPAATQPSQLEEVNARQQIVQQQMFREITNEQRAAEQQRNTDPIGALNRMQKLRGRVTSADLEPATKKQFLTFVDRTIQELEFHIEQNRSQIDLQQRNDRVLSSIEDDQRRLVETQDKLAELVEQFNTLMDERRYEEAEIVAKQAREIDPENAVVQNLVWKSRFAIRMLADMSIRELKEQGFVDAMQDVDRSSVVPPLHRSPLLFGDPKHWEDLSRARRRMMEKQNRRLSSDELEIQKSLETKVQVSFRAVPLGEALKTLCDLAGINNYIDPQGLAVEAVTSDEPITIELSKPISLRSALNLILQPRRLAYVIENDVLKITSEGARNSRVYADVYNVADLVIPIPNFVPGYNVGLPAAIREAHATLGQFGGSNLSSSLPMIVAANEGEPAPGGSILAQTQGFGQLRHGSLRSRPNQFSGIGAGGMGGAAMADFDTLIELITSTIVPDSWEQNGGNGAIEPFPTNLSLVISTTQDVHEQIADLLDQLRRLQDLQVAIEVRFITLNDDFFERIGIDFDFNIDDNTGLSTRTPQLPDDTGPSIVIGLDNLGQPTSNLDLQFTQDNFGAAVPQFGGFDAATAANFGFAILSDIEAFFLLQAAQGDRRSNVLQAPRVTLFNGQSATVADQSQRPFVTSIIPVVGDFAAAHMPVITVLGEGTSMSVQAVVSHDRRFVRLTLVPFFSQIGEVRTFTFQGSTTSDSGTNILDPDGNPIVKDNVQQTTTGSTVQLPTFSFTTVSTTVNVPDGGTVLLGGIKRLSEGRNERGVPMLSKLPYVSRLFKNVGIGRNTQSLMLMVTPRIIIQEEEEAKLGVNLDE